MNTSDERKKGKKEVLIEVVNTKTNKSYYIDKDTYFKLKQMKEDIIKDSTLSDDNGDNDNV